MDWGIAIPLWYAIGQNMLYISNLAMHFVIVFIAEPMRHMYLELY